MQNLTVRTVDQDRGAYSSYKPPIISTALESPANRTRNACCR